MKATSVKTLGQDDLEEIVQLTKLLNQNIPLSELKSRQAKMFEFDNYTCFGLYEKEQLIGVSSGWIK